MKSIAEDRQSSTSDLNPATNTRTFKKIETAHSEKIEYSDKVRKTTSNQVRYFHYTNDLQHNG